MRVFTILFFCAVFGNLLIAQNQSVNGWIHMNTDDSSDGLTNALYFGASNPLWTGERIASNRKANGGKGPKYGLNFLTNFETRLVIDNNGNVGIGTDNPSSKLEVKGQINARAIEVSLLAGADFVFENDYNLPTLEEVEVFVKNNKHLPEIASAEVMERDGVDLAKLSIKLLQKVEELTLYTIAQEKKINDQQLKFELQKEFLKKENEILINRLSKIEESLKKN